MKKFIMPLAAALALTGCASEDGLDPNNAGGNSNGELQYLSVSIVTADEGGSRAGDPYVKDGSTFEDGTETENNVNKVRFYFFDNAGQPAYVSDRKSYFDWIPSDPVDTENEKEPTNTTDQDNTVEKVLNAVIVLETGESGVLPVQIFTIVNPEDDYAASPTSSNIRGKQEDYASKANAENPTFEMTNSVYMTAGSKLTVDLTAIKPENIQKTKADALDHPVVIYVERNVAKVRVKTSMAGITGKSGMYQATDKDGNAIKVGETDVYYKIQGWNVTASTDKAWLLKHIDNTWGEKIENLLTWNAPTFHRSYWAAYCTDAKSQYNNFNDVQSKSMSMGGYTYCNENAQKDENKTDLQATQVIIPAILCDQNELPLTICEYAGIRMIGEDKLKKQYLDMLSGSDKKYYCEESSGGTTTYRQIKEDDVTFYTANEVAQGNSGKLPDGTPFTLGPTQKGAYYVYIGLKETAKAYNWYDTDQNPTTTNEVDPGTIDQELKKEGHAKIWESGQTYFYTDILQTVNESGTGLAGVVRNHIYDFNIQNIFGIGTPVYRPTETIYPEKPVDDDSYVAAQIDILSWRVVSNSPELDWGK